MTQQAGEDNPCDAALKAEDAEESAVPKVLREGDHSTDIIFTVEGRNLHFYKTMLTICSPVFHDLLTPEYIQQHSEGIPLPGKKYGAMAFFLQQLHPVYTNVTRVTDERLLDLLALAKEYQVEHINTKCEQYIGSQLLLHKYEKMLTTGKLLLYLTACDQHNLTTQREHLTKAVAEIMTEDLQATKFFEPVPATALKDVFLVRCQMLGKRIQQLESNLREKERELSSFKQKSDRKLHQIKLYIDASLSCFPPDFTGPVRSNLRHALKETENSVK